MIMNYTIFYEVLLGRGILTYACVFLECRWTQLQSLLWFWRFERNGLNKQSEGLETSR